MTDKINFDMKATLKTLLKCRDLGDKDEILTPGQSESCALSFGLSDRLGAAGEAYCTSF